MDFSVSGFFDSVKKKAIDYKTKLESISKPKTYEVSGQQLTESQIKAKYNALPSKQPAKSTSQVPTINKGTIFEKPDYSKVDTKYGGAFIDSGIRGATGSEKFKSTLQNIAQPIKQKVNTVKNVAGATIDFAKETPTYTKDIGKAFLSSSSSYVGGLLSEAKGIIDTASNHKDKLGKLYLKTHPVVNALVNTTPYLQDKFDDTIDTIDDKGKDVSKWLQEQVDIQNQYSNELNNSIEHKFLGTVASGGTSMMQFISNPSVMGLSIAGNAYDEFSKKYGEGDKAFAVGQAVGAWELASEKIQMNYLFSKLGGIKVADKVINKLFKIAKSYVGETFQETYQNEGTVWIEKLFFGNEETGKEYLASATERFIETAKVMTFLTAAPMGIQSLRQTKEYQTGVKQLQKDLSITKKQAEALAKDVLQESYNAYEKVKNDKRGSIPADFGLGDISKFPKKVQETLSNIDALDIPTEQKEEIKKDLIKRAMPLTEKVFTPEVKELGSKLLKKQFGEDVQFTVDESIINDFQGFDKAGKDNIVKKSDLPTFIPDHLADVGMFANLIKKMEDGTPITGKRQIELLDILRKEYGKRNADAAKQAQQELEKEYTDTEAMLSQVDAFDNQDLKLFNEARKVAEQNQDGDITNWRENKSVRDAIERYNEATGQSLMDTEAFQEIQALPTNTEIRTARARLKKISRDAITDTTKGKAKAKTQEMKDLAQQIKIVNRNTTKAIGNFKKDLKVLQDMAKGMIKDFKGDKGKFLNTILNIKTEAQFNKAFNEIEAKIKYLNKEANIKQLKEDISKQLKSIKATSGKVQADVMEELSTLKEVSRSTLKSLKSVMNITDADLADIDLNENLDDYLKNKYIIALVNRDVKLLESVSEDIKYLISEGKEARNSEIAEKLEKIDKGISVFKDVLIDKNKSDDVTLTVKGKEVKTSVKNYYEKIVLKAHSNTVLANNAIYAELLGDFLDRSTKSTQGKIYQSISVVDNELQYKKDVQDFAENVNVELANIFGKKKWKKELRKMLNKKYYISKDGKFTTKKSEAYSDSGSHNLTISEWINAYGISQVEGELGNVEYTYGKQFVELFQKILKANPNYQKVLDMTVEQYDNLYKRKNKVFKRVNGYGIRRANNYIHAKKTYYNTESGQKSPRGSAGLGSAKEKVDTKTIIKNAGIYETLLQQSEEINWYINSKEKYDQIQTVINSKEVASYVQTRLGDTGMNLLSKFKKRLARLATRETIKSSIKIDALNKAIAIYSRNRIIGKAKSYLTQISSILTDWTEIGAFKYPIYKAMAIKDMATGRAKKEMKELDRLVATRNTLQAETQMQLKTNIPLIKSVQNTLSYFIKTADKAAISGSQYPLYLYYKAELKKTTNLPLADIRVKAMLMAEERSSMTQQTDLQSLKADFQMTDNTFINLFKIFTSTQVQFAQQTKASQINLLLANKNAAREIRNITMFRFVQPLLYTFITSGFKNFWDDDDESKKNRNELLGALAMGNISAMPYLGDFMDYLGRSVFNQFVEQDIDQFAAGSAMDKLTKTIDKIIKGEVKFKGSESLRDYWVLRAAGDILDWMSPVPISTSINYLTPYIKPEVIDDMNIFDKIKLGLGYAPWTIGLDMNSNTKSLGKPKTSSKTSMGKRKT